MKDIKMFIYRTLLPKGAKLRSNSYLVKKNTELIFESRLKWKYQHHFQENYDKVKTNKT